ncbi:hypothetical protein CANCADRAFT_31590 [Tortispora caseinolytica NRRL Y-17796]|uniref:DNA polymerase alpha/delta/epsilon subunit B domain-containing protein n=1 Tax=Tortispora caseinolytica NRRL Y-17796 TaxID=767744 RepID=A0A1E4TG44_9ASCO|nr:hypothetical protein CANCADRAFT_31590 [Tortispora caseinolytica NRRL Y-17796]
MDTFDNFLAELATSIPVDVMPGAHDPSITSWPQQPLHKALFAKSRQLFDKSLTMVGNPNWWDIDSVVCLGTSGQNIDDMKKYRPNALDIGALDMMELTLRLRHCAPSAPDTLWAVPMTDADPFLMSKSPHVYFVGNQDRFETKMVTGESGQTTRLIAIPSFAATGQIVLMNLHTFECELINLLQGFE